MMWLYHQLDPATHPACKVSKLHGWRKVEIYFQNISYQSVLTGPKEKVFEPDRNPKNSPVGSKKGPKLGRIRNKRIGLYFHIHKLKVHSTILGAKITIWCSI